jgi:hypothetical protein
VARNARVGGGYTVFHWNNQPIAWAQSIAVTGVTPVTEPEEVQPMNALRPLEIVTPRASRHGTITLTMFELWNSSVWQNLAGLANSNDIIDIFEYVAGLDNAISITKYVRTPNAVGPDRYEQFFNVVVASVADDETVDITTTTLPKVMTLWYTHSNKSWINSPTRAATFT